MTIPSRDPLRPPLSISIIDKARPGPVVRFYHYLELAGFPKDSSFVQRISFTPRGPMALDTECYSQCDRDLTASKEFGCPISLSGNTHMVVSVPKGLIQWLSSRSNDFPSLPSNLPLLPDLRCVFSASNIFLAGTLFRYGVALAQASGCTHHGHGHWE